MIRDYNLEYAGLKPLYSFKEVQYLFSKATNGKALRDYVSFTANDWDNRGDRDRGLYFMNDLRINYIKKEARCCAGNKNHATKCRIDIGNVVPRKLKVRSESHVSYLLITLLTLQFYPRGFTTTMESTKLRKEEEGYVVS